jgi:hypothetical protein
MEALTDSLVIAGLEWERREEAEAAECLHRSFAESAAGKVRLFSEAAAEWRAKYNLPTHLSKEEILAGETFANICSIPPRQDGS